MAFFSEKRFFPLHEIVALDRDSPFARKIGMFMFICAKCVLRGARAFCARRKKQCFWSCAFGRPFYSSSHIHMVCIGSKQKQPVEIQIQVTVVEKEHSVKKQLVALVVFCSCIGAVWPGFWVQTPRETTCGMFEVTPQRV